MIIVFSLAICTYKFLPVYSSLVFMLTFIKLKLSLLFSLSNVVYSTLTVLNVRQVIRPVNNTASVVTRNFLQIFEKPPASCT